MIMHLHLDFVSCYFAQASLNYVAPKYTQAMMIYNILLVDHCIDVACLTQWRGVVGRQPLM